LLQVYKLIPVQDFFKGCLCFVGVEKNILEVLVLVLLVNLVTAARTVAGEVAANVTVISFFAS